MCLQMTWLCPGTCGSAVAAELIDPLVPCHHPDTEGHRMIQMIGYLPYGIRIDHYNCTVAGCSLNRAVSEAQVAERITMITAMNWAPQNLDPSLFSSHQNNAQSLAGSESAQLPTSEQSQTSTAPSMSMGDLSTSAAGGSSEPSQSRLAIRRDPFADPGINTPVATSRAQLQYPPASTVLNSANASRGVSELGRSQYPGAAGLGLGQYSPEYRSYYHANTSPFGVNTQSVSSASSQAIGYGTSDGTGSATGFAMSHGVSFGPSTPTRHPRTANTAASSPATIPKKQMWTPEEIKYVVSAGNAMGPKKYWPPVLEALGRHTLRSIDSKYYEVTEGKRR